MDITKDTPQDEILKISTKCDMRGHCCSMGVGFVKEDEIERLANHFKLSIEEFKTKYLEENIIFNKLVYKLKQNKGEKPFGPCVFLEENKCAIHAVKPLHCRVGNCNKDGVELTEWYYANHLVDFFDPQAVREWQTRIELKPTIKGATPKEVIGVELLKKMLLLSK